MTREKLKAEALSVYIPNGQVNGASIDITKQYADKLADLITRQDAYIDELELQLQEGFKQVATRLAKHRKTQNIKLLKMVADIVKTTNDELKRDD